MAAVCVGRGVGGVTQYRQHCDDDVVTAVVTTSKIGGVVWVVFSQFSRSKKISLSAGGRAAAAARRGDQPARARPQQAEHDGGVALDGGDYKRGAASDVLLVDLRATEGRSSDRWRGRCSFCARDAAALCAAAQSARPARVGKRGGAGRAAAMASRALPHGEPRVFSLAT